MIQGSISDWGKNLLSLKYPVWLPHPACYSVRIRGSFQEAKLAIA